MGKFDESYEEIMEMLAGDAYGGSGAEDVSLGNTDFYAPGDARIPSYIGAKKKKKKKKKKCKKDTDTDTVEVPLLTRRLAGGM